MELADEDGCESAGHLSSGFEEGLMSLKMSGDNDSGEGGASAIVAY